MHNNNLAQDKILELKYFLKDYIEKNPTNFKHNLLTF